MQKQKIRSQWKAQKRKEGLSSSRPPLPGEVHDRHDEGGIEEDEREPEAAPGVSAGSESGDDEEDDEMSESNAETELQAPSQHSTSRGRGNTKRDGSGSQGSARGRGRGRGGKFPHPDRESRDDRRDEEQVPSLRELQNKAYSRASLHTFKSNRKNGNSEGHGLRGSARGRGFRGRGQPDMRLRMNAMLEKIKRDVV